MEIAEAIKFLEDEEGEWWGYCCPVPVSDCGDKADFREALDMAIAALRAQQEVKSPCAACGYGGKHLDAPPCTECPAHPKETEKSEPPVRCKDCKFYERIEYWPKGHKYVCHILKTQMQPDDFCSYGEYGHSTKEDKADERD